MTTPDERNLRSTMRDHQLGFSLPEVYAEMAQEFGTAEEHERRLQLKAEMGLRPTDLSLDEAAMVWAFGEIQRLRAQDVATRRAVVKVLEVLCRERDKNNRDDNAQECHDYDLIDDLMRRVVLAVGSGS